MWNGVIIMVSILLQPLFDGAVDKLRISRKNPFFVGFQIFRTLLVVLVGYVFDVAPSFGEGMRTLSLFFTGQDFSKGMEEIGKLGLTVPDYIIILAGAVIILIASIIQERHLDTDIRTMLDRKPFMLRFLLLYLGIMTVVIFGIYGSGYNAADFVYMQF